MAIVENLFPFIGKWEGLYSNKKTDSGGITMRGITWDTYKGLCKIVLGYEPTVARHAVLTVADAEKFIRYFWNNCKASGLSSQRIANMIVDWNWGSGYWAIINTRRAINAEFNVGLDESLEYVTTSMINIINGVDEARAFKAISKGRGDYYGRLNASGHSHDTANYKGWMARLNDLVAKSPIPVGGMGAIVVLIGFFF